MLLLHHNPDLKWSPGSDSHRRLRVYETRPVAAEARGLSKWCPRQESHLRPSASQAGALIYLSYADEMASVIGLAPIRPGLKDRLLDLLCIHGLRNFLPRRRGGAEWTLSGVP